MNHVNNITDASIYFINYINIFKYLNRLYAKLNSALIITMYDNVLY